MESWCSKLSNALQNCEKWYQGELWERYTKDLLKGEPNRDVVELAHDLGLDLHIVWEKLKECFLSVDFVAKKIKSL